MVPKEKGDKMTPEGKVKEKIDAVLRKLDIYYFKPRGTTLGRAGIPDYVCCFKGIFIAIEAKANGNKLSALQYQEGINIAKHGGKFFVVNETNVDELEGWLLTYLSLPTPEMKPIEWNEKKLEA
jgi:hypothetical protein